MAILSASDIRARLNRDEVELPDTLLYSAAFLPAGEAWLAKYVSYDSLDDNDKALAKAAGVAYVASKVVLTAPQAGAKYGPIQINDLRSAEIAVTSKAFYDEAVALLSEMDVLTGSGGFAFSGQGSDEIDDAMEYFE
jgi:hypothetical protein